MIAAIAPRWSSPGANRPARALRAAEDAAPDPTSLAEQGEEALESRGVRLRARRYTSAHMLTHDAQERLDAFARDCEANPPSDSGDVLDKATSLFEDPSDVYAALDALSGYEGLAGCIDLFEQAQSRLVDMLPPGWVETGLNVALLAKQHAGESGMRSIDLRDVYRRFVLSSSTVLASFAQWVRELDERRRRIVVGFICAGLAAEIDIVDPACSKGEGDRRRALLRELCLLARAELDFVQAMLVAVHTGQSVKLPARLRSSFIYSLIFVGIGERSVTAEGVVDWLVSLGADSTNAKVLLTAALYRETAKLGVDAIGDTRFRERLLDGFATRLSHYVDQQRAEQPAWVRSAIA